MNRIVLIGNGFDLAHGMNTSYKHFICWYLSQWGSRLLNGIGKELSDGLLSMKIKDGINVPNWASAFQGWYYKRQNPLIPAERQFHNDIEAMEACDVCVLVLPCGRSAHTEAGWFAGKGRTTIAYIPERQEPELMYKLFSGVCCSMDELINVLL